jgi:hypothetical protein
MRLRTFNKKTLKRSGFAFWVSCKAFLISKHSLHLSRNITLYFQHNLYPSVCLFLPCWSDLMQIFNERSNFSLQNQNMQFAVSVAYPNEVPYIVSSFQNTGRWTKLRNPVVLSVINHPQKILQNLHIFFPQPIFFTKRIQMCCLLTSHLRR